MEMPAQRKRFQADGEIAAEIWACIHRESQDIESEGRDLTYEVLDRRLLKVKDTAFSRKIDRWVAAKDLIDRRAARTNVQSCIKRYLQWIHTGNVGRPTPGPEFFRAAGLDIRRNNNNRTGGRNVHPGPDHDSDFHSELSTLGAHVRPPKPSTQRRPPPRLQGVEEAIAINMAKIHLKDMTDVEPIIEQVALPDPDRPGRSITAYVIVDFVLRPHDPQNTQVRFEFEGDRPIGIIFTYHAVEASYCVRSIMPQVAAQSRTIANAIGNELARREQTSQGRWESRIPLERPVVPQVLNYVTLRQGVPAAFEWGPDQYHQASIVSYLTVLRIMEQGASATGPFYRTKVQSAYGRAPPESESALRAVGVSSLKTRKRKDFPRTALAETAMAAEASWAASAAHSSEATAKTGGHHVAD